jgi:hypothetical protein
MRGRALFNSQMKYGVVGGVCIMHDKNEECRKTEKAAWNI